MRETIEGFVVDIACLRKWPAQGRRERAERHSKKCALMGHCVESGYGLVDDDGRLALLDASATGELVRRIRDSERTGGIRLRVERDEDEDGEMVSNEIREV